MEKRKRERKYITLKELERLDACNRAKKEFEANFGEKATIKEVVEGLHKNQYEYWEVWLLTSAPSLTEALIKNGANVHASDDCAICAASMDGQSEVVEILIQNGADVRAQDDYPLERAVLYGYAKTVEILLKHVNDVEICKTILGRTLESGNRHSKIRAILKKHIENLTEKEKKE